MSSIKKNIPTALRVTNMAAGSWTLTKDTYDISLFTEYL